MRNRCVGMILGISLPLFLHFMLYALDEHDNYEVILACFMVLHSLAYLPAVLMFGPGQLAWWFTLILWCILGYVLGSFFDRKGNRT